jgi:hypothetical protein
MGLDLGARKLSLRAPFYFGNFISNFSRAGGASAAMLPGGATR